VRNFVTRFLQQADEFVSQLDQKSANKVFYNIDLAEQTNDQKLFKKLKGEIWEFRSKYLGNQNRLLAFWDKTEKTETWPRYLPAVGILANGAETTSHIERRYLPSGRYHRPT
jgi:hypothetical protein